MNRQQRRSAKKRKPPRPPDKFKPDAKTADLTLKTSMLIALTVLHDKYGFGRIRLTEFVKHFQSGMESVTGGFVSIYDLNEQLDKETGVLVFDREQYRHKPKLKNGMLK